MAEWRVPLSDLRIPESDIEAVAQTYRSGWLTMGPRTEELEQAFAAYTGVRHAVAVSSGTAALHLSCLAAGLGAGDEVIVPSLTFVATVSAVAATGAKPVFAEIVGLEGPWLSAAATERVIGERTKAIMTMTYGGHPGETAALAELAEQRGLVLLEDAAHAVGSRLRGRHLGSFGLAGAFSFFSNKNLAIGEGGMVVTDNDEVAAHVRALRSWGVTKLEWDRRRGRPTDYDVETLGFNYRIDEPRATLALRRLPRVDDENRMRSALATAYQEALAGIDGVSPALPETDDATLSHHLFAVVLDEAIDRDALRASLADRGIETSVHYPPVHRFSFYGEGDIELPVTDDFSRRALTLPLFPHLTTEQLELVSEALATSTSTAMRSGRAPRG